MFQFKVTKNSSANFRRIPKEFQAAVVSNFIERVLVLLVNRIKRDTPRYKGTARNSIIASRPVFGHMSVLMEGRVYGTAKHLNPLVHGRKSSRMPISALQTWAKSKGFGDPIRAGYAIWMWRQGFGNSPSNLTPRGAEGWGTISSPKAPSDAWKNAASEMKRTVVSQFKAEVAAFFSGRR